MVKSIEGSFKNPIKIISPSQIFETENGLWIDVEGKKQLKFRNDSSLNVSYTLNIEKGYLFLQGFSSYHSFRTPIEKKYWLLDSKVVPKNYLDFINKAKQENGN